MKKNTCLPWVFLALFVALILNPFSQSVSAQDGPESDTTPSPEVVQQFLAARGSRTRIDVERVTHEGTGVELPERTIIGQFNDLYDTTVWTAGVYSQTPPMKSNYDLFLRVPLSKSTVINLTNTIMYDELYPRLSSDSSEVIFVSDETGNYDIYRMNIDGSQKRNLTNAAGDDYSPVWSQDNQWIAYVHETNGVPQIYLMNANGGGNYQLTNWAYGSYGPSFSPDASQLVYVRVDNDAGDTTLLVSNRDGSKPYILPGSEYYPYPATPSWSPNGEMIAFSYLNIDPLEVRAVVLDIATRLPLNIFSYGRYPYDYLRDILINGWSPDSNYLTMTVVTYYIGWGYLDFYTADGIGRLAMPAPNTDFQYEFSFGFRPDLNSYIAYPSWQSADETPPQTYLEIPAYSRYMSKLHWLTDSTGLARVSEFQIQTRDGESNPWLDIPNPTGVISSWQPDYTYVLPAGGAGTTREYRARARDIAGRWEQFSSPSNRPVETTYYNWNLRGTLLDNRNRPIQGQTLTLSVDPVLAPPSDANGQYRWLIGDPGSFILDVDRPGYGGLPTTSFQSDQDLTYNVYLPPADNQVVNGEFETATLDGWMIGGGLPVQVTESSSKAGSQSLALGAGCPDGCFMEPGEVMMTGQTQSTATLFYDPEGTAYFISFLNSTSQIRYRSRGGEWSQSLVIGDVTQYSTFFSISSVGRFYVLFHDTNDNHYYGYYRDPNGSWSAKFSIGGLVKNEPDLLTLISFTADHSNNLHLLMTSTGGLMYYRYEISGGGLIGINTGAGSSDYHDLPLIAILPDNSPIIIGRTYTLFGEPDGTFRMETYIRDSNIWMSTMNIFYDEMDYPFVVGFDSDHIPHRFLMRSLDEFLNWTPTMLIVEMNPFEDYGTPCQDGSVLFLNILGRSLLRWRPGGGVETLAWPGLEYPAMSIACDADNMPAMVYHQFAGNSEYFYLVEGNSTNPANTAEVSQQVIIPAGMYQPTLSFAYQLESIRANGQTGLEVLIRDQNSVETSLHSLKGSNSWRQEWADLSPWAGQTVTIVFRLNQAANEPSGLARIDSVAVGSWTTPIIHSVEPARFHDLAQVPEITVLGENFNEAIGVYLSGAPLSAEEYSWVDENTLKIKTPVNLQQGCYTLMVENPGGAAAERVNAFCYMHFLYLPAVLR